MPTDYLGSRREWFLPLFGGAEMNRIKPPAESMYFTSQMYPYQLLDSLTSEAGLVPSRDTEVVDFVGVGLSMLDGTSRESLLFHAMTPEYMQVGLGMLEGSSQGFVYHTYKATPEYMQGGLSILDGTSLANLVRYTNWPTEHVNTTASLLDGTST